MSLSKLLELDVEWTHKAQSISVGYLEIFIYPGVGWMFLGKFWVYHYFETLRSHASISVSGDNLDDPFFYIWDSSQNPPKSGDVRLANLCF